jgi:hypothetical protein
MYNSYYNEEPKMEKDDFVTVISKNKKKKIV